jgi:WD40 repeat protein/beta-lactamase regulating signal transducer with metallopeptidase domain
MSALLYLGLANAACAAVLAVLAVVVGRWARRPALAHGVWLLVLVKLVTPPLFPLPVASLPAAPAPEAVAVTDEPRPAPVVYSAVHESDSVGPPSPADVWIEMEKVRAKGAVVPERARAAQERTPAPAAVTAPEAPSDFVGDYVDANTLPAAPALERRPAEPPAAPALADVGEFVATVLGGAWLVGSVVWFARSARRLARFQRLLRLARPAPEHVRTLAARLAQQFGLRRCPEVLLLPAPLPPMVWGALGRVRVLLPARLVERLDEDQLAALLAHELAHVRRGDHWVRRLEFVVLGLYWWYPLAWWARTRLQEAEEECCDAWVVEALPARAYAAAIVATVDFLANDLEPAPALASGLGRLDGLKRRLTLILTGTSPKRLSVAGRLAVLVVGFALLPLLPTLGRSANKPDDKAAPNQEADEGAATEPGEEAIAFQPNPLVLVGGNFENFSLTVSADGRYLAAGSGFWDRPGEVHVWTVADHKEVLAYATAKGVASVAFSPDGRYIGSAGYDGQAIIREFPSGKVVQVLPLDGAARMAFSPDNKTVATATEAKTVKLWNLTTGKEIARLEGELYRWHCLAFSHDGKLLAVGGGDWNENGVSQVNFWDTTTHKLVGKLSGHARPVLCLAFSPDKKTIATGAVDNTVRLWQLDGFKELGALDGHENWVEGLAYTPDGGTLISSSHDGTVRLWDVAKKMPITRLDGHVAPVRSVAVSHDGKHLFSGGAARMLKVWDLATQKETGNYQPRVDRPGQDSIILATAYSPDGKTLATAHENGTLKIRNAANGDLLRIVEGHEDAVTCLVFTKDGKTLITGSSDRTVRLWDVETGKPRATLEGHTSWVYALALSPDGKTLASAGYDKTIRLWDLETHKAKATLTGHKGAVRALAFSPDGKTLASGAGDHTIKLWDVETHEERTTITGHEGTVRSVAFAPDGKALASGSEDATVRLWDEAGAARSVLKGHNGKVSAVAFSPRGRYVVSAGMDNTCRLWDTTTGQPVQTLRGHDDAVTCLAWAPDGRFLITGGYDKAVKLWVVTTGVLRMLTGHTGPVQMASFSPDGKYVLSCSAWPAGDKTIRLWGPQTGKEIRKFEGHTGPVGCAVFSPDGKRALSGSHDKTVRLWDVETGKQLRLLEGHEDEVPRVAFSPDGKRAASASHDKTVRIWDLESGDCLHVLRGHADHVRGLVFLPDGTHVVSADVQGTLRVWDADKGTETNKIELPKGRINHLRLAPDGKRLAVAHAQSVRVLDLETGKQLRQFDGHGQGVTDVAWSPDGKTLLSGSYDNTARLWDVETGRELHVFRGHRNYVWSVNFSADGQRILTAGGGARNGEEWVAGNDFAIRIWPLPDTSAKPGRVFKVSNLKLEK